MLRATRPPRRYHELEPTRSGTGIPGTPLVTITDEQGASTRYRTVATRFNDAATVTRGDPSAAEPGA